MTCTLGRNYGLHTVN